MADYAGATDLGVYILVDGRLDAPDFSQPNVGETGGTLTVLGDTQAAGNFEFVSQKGTPPLNDYVGEVKEEWSMGLDWFEKVHLVPRSKLTFGNIITEQELTFELYNAHRLLSVNFQAFVNNAGTGLTVPDLPTPVVLFPTQSSFLDPTTTRLSPVLLPVVAARDGVPSFDTTLDFTFDSGELLMLGVSGNRIALITAQPHVPVREILEFKTDIIRALNGKEQRISLRKQPRQGYRCSYDLDEGERRRLQSLLFGWTANNFAVPLWHEQVRSTAAASATDTSIAVDSTTDVDFRVGGLGVVYESEEKFDVIIISAVAASTITFATTPLTNSYATNIRVMPIRLCNLIEIPRGTRHLNNLEEFELVFECADNDTGAPTASQGSFSTYNSKVLFDDCNVQNAGMVFELPQKIQRIDNGTGATFQKSRWPYPRRLSRKGFGAHTRSEILALKKLLLFLKGKQKSFYLPTFIEDLEVNTDLVVSSDKMRIANIGYTRFINALGHKATFRITYTDGTSEVKIISAASEIDSTTEELTITVAWAANKTVAQIQRVEFYELVRFDNDYFEIVHERVGSARLLAPVRTIFE